MRYNNISTSIVIRLIVEKFDYKQALMDCFENLDKFILETKKEELLS